MKKILKKICDYKKKELEITKSKCSLKSLIKLLPDKKNKKFKYLVEIKNLGNCKFVFVRVSFEKRGLDD